MTPEVTEIHDRTREKLSGNLSARIGRSTAIDGGTTNFFRADFCCESYTIAF
jgi:hypothetical protein